jgi:DNA-binding transcriptional LysR family regulator
MGTRRSKRAGDKPSAAPPLGTGVRRYSVVRHLPYFVVVAQEVHFHRAAEILHITQSALSRRIQALESDLGGKLFHRSARGVTLTQLGRSFYDDVRSILVELEGAVGRVRALVRGDEGRLRIALNEGALRSPAVTRTLADFQRLRPRVALELVPMLTEDQFAGLESQALDGGFLYELPTAPLSDAGYQTREVSAEALVLAVPSGHDLV